MGGALKSGNPTRFRRPASYFCDHTCRRKELFDSWKLRDVSHVDEFSSVDGVMIIFYYGVLEKYFLFTDFFEFITSTYTGTCIK